MNANMKMNVIDIFFMIVFLEVNIYMKINKL
jgi:hypothetical protein